MMRAVSQYIINERGNQNNHPRWAILQQVLPTLDVEEGGNLEVRMEESNMDWQLALIEEVKTFPCIWNAKARVFKESPRKQVTRNIISQRLNTEIL